MYAVDPMSIVNQVHFTEIRSPWFKIGIALNEIKSYSKRVVTLQISLDILSMWR